MQVGIVLMSILCHIWKIVPDLYEAITRMSSSPSDHINGTFINIVNCSIQGPVNEVGGIKFVHSTKRDACVSPQGTEGGGRDFFNIGLYKCLGGL